MDKTIIVYHAILFGNVLGNLALIIGFFRFVRRRYLNKRHLFEKFVQEHDEMYKEFCKKHQKEREFEKPRLQLI